MNLLKTYEKTVLNLDQLRDQIQISGCVSGDVALWNSENELRVYGDQLLNESELDSIVNNFID